MKRKISKTISFCILTFIIISCNSDNSAQIDSEKIDKKDNSNSILFTNKQLELITEHNKICTVINRYRFFLEYLIKSSTDDNFQVYITKNWKQEQKLLLSYSKDLTDISRYILEYQNQKSIVQQIQLIPEIEFEINKHFHEKDKSIDWKYLMENSKPPYFRK
jgi:hypothetical protein